MSYTNVWSDTQPTGSEAANTIDDIIRSGKVDVEQRFVDIFNMPNFTADPLRPYGIKFTNAQDSIIFLGNNGGTPRKLIIDSFDGGSSYVSFSASPAITVHQGGINISGGITVASGTTTLLAVTTLSIVATGSISATSVFISGVAGSATGGQYRVIDDGGTFRWTFGIGQSVGARNFIIFDQVNGSARITIDSSTGATTVGANLIVSGTTTLASAQASSFTVTPGATSLQAVTATTVTANFVDSASNPATSGVIRLSNTGLVNARNAANSLNVTLLTLNSSDIVVISDGSHGTKIDNSTSILAIGTMVTTNGSNGDVALTNSTAPTGNPTGGVFLYVESGYIKVRGPSGTITTLAAA